MCKISIIIKSLNEEEHVAKAIESSLAAIADYDGEVILADSVSTDKTIDIARQYPIKIVQLANATERCCGIGPQLGLQHSVGEYVYILDGDMELQSEFISKGIDLLESDSSLAGVAGFIDEKNVSNLEFRGRKKRLHEQRIKTPKEVVCLGGGGLYRRKSLDSVAYMSDRNLHGFEEYDLGVRLSEKGWRLLSIPQTAAKHYSYSLGTLSLIWHRIKSGSIFSQGELLRAAITNGYWPRPFSDFKAIRMSFGIIFYWCAAIIVLLAPTETVVNVLAIISGPVAYWAIVAYRHRSPVYGLFSLIGLHISAIGMLLGLMRKRHSPVAPIASQVI